MNEFKIIICFQPPPASVSSGASEGKYDPRGTSDDVVVTSQPTKSSDPIVLGGPPLPPTTEAAGSPKRENSDEADENTALNNGDKVGYTTGEGAFLLIKCSESGESLEKNLLKWHVFTSIRDRKCRRSLKG